MATTRKLALILEYVGTRYNGFQLQAGQPTVQGETETALLKLTGEKLRVIPASRTDTGVHAKGQVVTFRTISVLPVETFVKGLNYYLPGDIAVKAAYRVADSFDVRRHATSREYRYYILNSETRSPIWRGFSHLVMENLDVEAMDRASQCLVGEHDFASFASRVEAKLKNTVRRVMQAVVERKGDLVIFDMVAKSFLTHQIRNTVGTLLRVGQGKMNIDEFCSIIDARQFGLAGPPVPACGLFLIKINYPIPWSEMNENV